MTPLFIEEMHHLIHRVLKCIQSKEIIRAYLLGRKEQWKQMEPGSMKEQGQGRRRGGPEAQCRNAPMNESMILSTL